jgi:hypothetical protein
MPKSIASLLIVFLGFAVPPLAAQRAQPELKIAPSDGKVRVYIADSQSWQVTGGWGASNGSGGGHQSGGARPQTAEIFKTFNERCPKLTTTNNKEKANYAVILDHEGGKGLLAHRNKVVVFNRDGDTISSASTRSLGNSVKDACEAIQKDYATHKNDPPIPNAQAAPATPAPAAQAPIASAPESPASISLVSNPPSAHITVDDAFVGNSPATLKLMPGKHTIRVTMSGYKDWSREMTVLAGSEVNLTATLEKRTRRAKRCAGTLERGVIILASL